MTATELKKRAIALAEKTKIDSVTPEEVGQLSNDIVEYIENVEINGSSLGIRKTYTSVSAMEADSTAPKDDKGVLLRRGMLVNIYNQSDQDSADNGKVFSFQNPGWAFRGTVDAGYATKEELTELDNQVFDLETGKISTDGTYDKKRVLEPSASSEWQTFDNPFPDNIDCDINVNNPNGQTIFIAFSSVAPYLGQQYFYADLAIKGLVHTTITRQGKTPSRTEYPYILVKTADDADIKITIAAGEDKNIFNDIAKVSEDAKSDIDAQNQVISDIQDVLGGKETKVDIQSFKMTFQSVENVFAENDILTVNYNKTQAARTEVYFSKASDNNTEGTQEIYRSKKIESGYKQVVAPSVSEYPYIIYKSYDLQATISLSSVTPTLDEKVEENAEKLKSLENADTHIPTLQETASVSIMLDYIDAFFAWCDVANPMGIPLTCCMNAFILKNRTPQEKEKFKLLMQKGNGFIAHGWNPHKGSNNFSDTEFEDTIKSAKEYFVSQGLKTEGWCPPENYSDVHSAIILSKYYNFSIGTTGQRYFSGEARFITASTNRWYIPRHGLDNTESLEYALTLLEEAVKNKKHLALYAHDTADTGDRDRLLNVIKDYVDKSQLVVVDANTQYTSLLKTWRNNISVNKPVFPFVGSSYFDNGVKVCTYYGTRERVKISFEGTAANGVITLKEYTTTLFRSENIDNEVEGTSYSNKPWSVNTTDGMSIQDICTALASIHLTCHTIINMGEYLIVESDIPRKWTNTISVSENTSELEVNIEMLEDGVNSTYQ